MARMMSQRMATAACDVVAANAPGGRGGFPPRRPGGFPFLAVVYDFADLWRRRAVIRQLDRLNDHYLRDIGISRGEIDAVADTLLQRWQAAKGRW